MSPPCQSIIPNSKQMDIQTGTVALLGDLAFWQMNFLCWALFWQGIVYFWCDPCRCQPMKNKPLSLLNYHHWMGRWQWQQQWQRLLLHLLLLLHVKCEFHLPWPVIYGQLSMQMQMVQGVWVQGCQWDWGGMGCECRCGEHEWCNPQRGCGHRWSGGHGGWSEGWGERHLHVQGCWWFKSSYWGHKISKSTSVDCNKIYIVTVKK